MAYEMKENSGALFKNDRKTEDTHPNATGSALIGGVEYFVSAWTKEGKNGKFQSLAFKPKDGHKETQKPAPKTATRASVDELDSDLPF